MSDSLAAQEMDRLVATHGKAGAHRTLDLILDELSVVALAALAHDWREFWARPKQLPPDGEWRSWGFLAARAFGKTRAVAEHINSEVEAGRARSVGLCAQNEDKTVELQVENLIKFAPPWFRPEYVPSALTLVWPNGATANVRTPEAPGPIRGGNHEIAWLSEIQSWPTATREEAYANFLFATRIGYAHTIWDATPKKRHPILLSLLARSAAEPTKHVVVRGTIREASRHLAVGVIDDLEREWAGTSRGKEELGGEMLDDDDGALVKQVTLDDNRRHKPANFSRKAIGIDPAVTTRGGSDRTGISVAGLGTDDRLYVLADLSGKHDATKWALLTLETYVNEGCDLVVVETNKGGNLLVQNLRAVAKDIGLKIEVVDEKWRPHRVAGTVFVREIFSRGEKSDRARPLATAYERGRVSHVIGVDLVALEDILTTWKPEPGQRSPDPLEALVHVAGELLGLSQDRIDPSVGFKGIVEMGRKVIAPAGRGSLPLSGGGGRGGRI